MRQDPRGVASNMVKVGASAFARNSECTMRRKTQNEAKLIFELLREAAGAESFEDCGDETIALRCTHTTVLESTRHLCPRPPVPETAGVCFHESDAAFDRVGIASEQEVAKLVQRVFIERFESGETNVHRRRCRRRLGAKTNGNSLNFHDVEVQGRFFRVLCAHEQLHLASDIVSFPAAGK